jgi:hypothetical protein
VGSSTLIACHWDRSGRPHYVRVGTVLIAIGIISLVAFGSYGSPAPALTQPSAPASSSVGTSFSVTASAPFHFTESTDEVAANATITLTFANTDSLPHTFSLFSVEGIAIPSDATVNYTGVTYGGHFHPFLFVLYENVTGTHPAYSFPAPASGWYEFVSSEPGDFSSGMFSAIGFGVPAPSNLTGGGPPVTVSWPVYVIAGTIVGLVILGLVLGFANGQRGEEHQMPPERLGYPEPPVTSTASASLPPDGSRPPPRSPS